MKPALGRRNSLRHTTSAVETQDEEAAARLRLETMHELFPERHDRIAQHLASLCEQVDVTSGRVLELGGRRYDHGKFLVGDLEHLHLVPEFVPDESDPPMEPGQLPPDVLLGDITRCAQLPSGSFDAVISVDIFEHLREPWLAAKEIVRLLRPGGFTYHSTLFSWRYHPAPADYWRFTPDALTFLFEDLELVRSDFDTLERRRNLVGRGNYRIEPDAFGGWRENWRVFYAGVKPEA